MVSACLLYTLYIHVYMPYQHSGETRYSSLLFPRCYRYLTTFPLECRLHSRHQQCLKPCAFTTQDSFGYFYSLDWNGLELRTKILIVLIVKSCLLTCVHNTSFCTYFPVLGYRSTPLLLPRPQSIPYNMLVLKQIGNDCNLPLVSFQR